MHSTPKKTVKQIVASENHYCIGLKANQPKLLDQARACAQTQLPLSQSEIQDTTHGRVVTRRVQVFAAPPELTSTWVGLSAFVRVERWGIRDGKPFAHQSWYILSQIIEAQTAGQLIQAHRGTTENKLHWVKDVVQGEDGSLIQAPNPATLVAFLRSWAISVFRKAGYVSITKAMRLFKHDLPTLLSFF